MGNADDGTAYMRVGGDDGKLRPWHYICEGRRSRGIKHSLRLTFVDMFVPPNHHLNLSIA